MHHRPTNTTEQFHLRNLKFLPGRLCLSGLPLGVATGLGVIVFIWLGVTWADTA